MATEALRRPEKVTMACVFIGLSCALWFYFAATLLSSWTSLETQQSILDAIGENPIAGVETTQVVEYLRWLMLATAAVAVAGIVLAFYTARGHQASRVLLTILAGFAAVSFLATGLIGIIPAAFAIGCGFYLWSADARLWFRQKNGQDVSALLAQATPAVAQTSPAPLSSGGAPTRQAPEAPVWHGPDAGPGVNEPAPPGVYVAPAASAPSPNDRRPAPLVLASVVTFASAGLVTAFSGLWVLLALGASDEIEAAIAEHPMQAVRDLPEQLGMDIATIVDLIAVTMGVALVLSILAIAAAGLTLAGFSFGRFALLGLSFLTVGLGILTLPFGLLWSGLAIWVVVLLSRPVVRAWFRVNST